MRLTGLGVSPGIGIGKALVLQARHPRRPLPRARRRASAAELERLAGARERSREQLAADQGPHRRSRPAPSTPTCSTRSC